jgi:hypothetical protein
MANPGLDDLGQHHVLIFGHTLRQQLDLPICQWLVPYEHERGFTWRLLPPPTVRSQTYAEPAFNHIVKLLFKELK